MQEGQYVETFVCDIAGAAVFEVEMRTQHERKKVKQIQVSNVGISEAVFSGGLSTLKAKNNQTPFFSTIDNHLLFAQPYVKAEDRGLSLRELEVPAGGLDLVLSGTLTTASTGTLYITLFYE